jgi:hypothetical protein
MPMVGPGGTPGCLAAGAGGDDSSGPHVSRRLAPRSARWQVASRGHSNPQRRHRQGRANRRRDDRPGRVRPVGRRRCNAGRPGSGHQPVFLHDPSVARRDISGRRLDTRAEMALSREISDPREALRGPEISALLPQASVAQPRPRDGRGRARRPSRATAAAFRPSDEH